MFFACEGGLPQFTLVLNEIINEIKENAFNGLGVTAVTGDTSSIYFLRPYSFANVNPQDGNKLDFTLTVTEWPDYPENAFVNVDLKLHINHGAGASMFTQSGVKNISIEYIDAHLLGNEGWWAEVRPQYH